MRESRALGRWLPIAGLGLLLSTQPGRAEAPRGFLDRGWGTPWGKDAIRSLPGCEAQGEIIAEIDGYLALVAQPECVGYELWGRHRVTLILIYRNVPWHPLDTSRRLVDSLLASPRLWGLTPENVARLESWSVKLDRLARLRALHGGEAPVFPHITDIGPLPDPVPGTRGYRVRALPPATQGLQGYQVNFPHKDYGALRSALRAELGAPTREAPRGDEIAGGSSRAGEVLEWSGDRTVAILAEHGRSGESGYFVTVTREYLRLVTEQHDAVGATGRRMPIFPSPVGPGSYPWVLEVMESIHWTEGLPRDTP